MDGLNCFENCAKTAQCPWFSYLKDDEIDEVFGLKMGADDYITKPFSQRLLIEQIRAVIRRSAARTEAPATASKSSISRGIFISTMNAMTACGKWPVNLTVTEFLIVDALVQRPGVVKAALLMDAAYDDQVYVDDRTIDSHIKRLRRKFRAVDGSFDAIETLYGVGYRYKVS